MDKEKIINLLNTDINILNKQAFKIRKEFLGNKVYIRGLIEFSNYCVRNCLYCGLRRSNQSIKRYRMSKEEILETSKRIIDLGIETIVLQSGDDFYYTDDLICEIIKEIKKYSSNTAITLSIGERHLNSYVKFYNAGADRYLLKIETTNKELYKKLHPNQKFETRENILKHLKQIGYQIGSGNIVGLPDQTLEDLANDILFLKKIDIDMAGIGPFIPQNDTPLGKYKKGDLELSLKVLAITRLACPTANLPATTAILSSENGNNIEILQQSFLAGANVCMISFTPEVYRKDYIIYDNRAKIWLQDIETAAKSLNLSVSLERGDRIVCCMIKSLK